MVINPKDIKWSSYSKYEGPFFRGSIPYVLPENPTEADRRLKVMTSVESGRYDAINMWDRCVLSVGLIQLCEARYYFVSKLLNKVAKDVGPQVVLTALQPALDFCCAQFKLNSKNQWRFFILEDNQYVEVDTLKKQQQLFLGCDGEKGSWEPIDKLKAKLWASCMANIWENTEAQKVQVKHVNNVLPGAFGKNARKILFGDDDPGDEGWSGMIKAGILSFAGNLPSTANKHLQIATDKLKSPKWSESWCIGVLQELTFGPQIKIYPQRYDAIRPWLESLWDGINLPKTSDDLKNWREELIIPIEKLPPILKVDNDSVTIKQKSKIKENKFISVLPPKNNGILGWILYILSTVMKFITRNNKNNE